MGLRVSPFPFGVLCQESFVGGFGRSGIVGGFERSIIARSSRRSLDARVSWFYLYMICFSIGLSCGMLINLVGMKQEGI